MSFTDPLLHSLSASHRYLIREGGAGVDLPSGGKQLLTDCAASGIVVPLIVINN